MLLWDRQQLVHHGRELGHLDNALPGGVVVCEDLQHVPVQLQVLGAVGRGHAGLDEVLELVHASLINDGMRIHGGGLGSDVLPAELQPLVKGDDTSRLEIHGVKHLLPGSILLRLSLVELRVCRSIAVSSGHRCCSVNQLGE